MRHPLFDLQNKMVEVRSQNDVVYRGILIEASDTAVMLRSENGWIEIPTEKVVSIEKYTPKTFKTWTGPNT
ncbi:MAG: hypothetical protein NT009_03390 [Proteobacteria bacterium]|nr:hypothetical protein [Pseudomonadota bacterium]